MSKKEKTKRDLVSINEAAEINGVTRQAIYVAIKLNKLKAVKHESVWKIDKNDLEEYRETKYSRTKSTFNGELLYNNKKGYYSINQTAILLKVHPQKIYYATRIGLLKAHRKGSAWVILKTDIDQYRDEYLKQQKPRKVKSA